MNRISRVYLIALLWGIAAAVLALLATRGRPTLPDFKLARDILTAVFLFFAGRIGKRHGAKPVGVGMVAGLLYGVSSGGSALFTHVTRAEAIKALHGHVLPPGGITAVVTAANSPGVHIAAWLGSIVLALVGGIILGAIGGWTTQMPSAAQDV